MRSSTFFGLLFGLLQLVEGQLTPWDNIIFFFGWEPYEPTLVRCSTIDLGWDARRGAQPMMQAPFSFIALNGGFQPYQIASVSDTGYNWTVELPTGGPYMVTMKDANGYTGGTSLVFQVTDPPTGVTCNTNAFSPNSLSISVTGSFAECSGLIVTAQGGTPPYTMQIIVSQRPPKTTTWTTSTMSYTIDLQPSEQFFVLVTDSTGKRALDGIHTVGTGDTACYEVATTVVSGIVPTTLSYDPTSTVSIPSRTSTGTGAASIIQNTATTTVTTVVTLRDGSSTTYTLGPNASVTVEDNTNTNTNEKKVNLPAIIGGALGGVAFVVLILFIFFLMRRRDLKKKKRMIDERNAKEGRQLSGSPMMDSSQPGAPHLTPGHESAPLMTHMDSTYSAVTTTTTSPVSSGYTPGMSQYTHTPWTIPDPTSHVPINPVPMQHSNVGGSDGSRRPSLSVTMNTPGGSDTGLPPGAMAPARIGSIASYSSSSQGIKSPTKSLTSAVSSDGRPEKTTFSPTSTIAAPPPYSAANAYRK